MWLVARIAAAQILFFNANSPDQSERKLTRFMSYRRKKVTVAYTGHLSAGGGDLNTGFLSAGGGIYSFIDAIAEV